MRTEISQGREAIGRPIWTLWQVTRLGTWGQMTAAETGDVKEKEGTESDRTALGLL